MRLPLKQVRSDHFIKILKKMGPIPYTRIRQTCRFVEEFAETNQEHIDYQFHHITISFNLFQEPLLNGVDYIQLPTKWTHVFRNYPVEEVDFVRLLGATRIQRVVVNINSLNDFAAVLLGLSRVSFKCTMLTINMLRPYDFTPFIAKVQPIRLSLVYLPEHSLPSGLPRVSHPVQEMDVFIDYNLPFSELNGLEGVDRLIIRPSMHITKGQLFALFRGILSSDVNAQQVALKIGRNVGKQLTDPEYMQTVISECLGYEVEEAERDEMMIGTKLWIKTDLILPGEMGVVGVLKTRCTFISTYLHFIPHSTDRLPWTLIPVRQNTHTLFTF